MYLRGIKKKNWKITIRNGLDLETVGSWPIMAKTLPGQLTATHLSLPCIWQSHEAGRSWCTWGSDTSPKWAPSWTRIRRLHRPTPPAPRTPDTAPPPPACTPSHDCTCLHWTTHQIVRPASHNPTRPRRAPSWMARQWCPPPPRAGGPKAPRTPGPSAKTTRPPSTRRRRSSQTSATAGWARSAVPAGRSGW